MVVTSPAVGSQDTKSVTPDTKTGAQLKSPEAKKPPPATPQPGPQEKAATSKPVEAVHRSVAPDITDPKTSIPPADRPKDKPAPNLPAATNATSPPDQHLPPQPPNLSSPQPGPITQPDTKPTVPPGEDLDPGLQPPLLPLPTIPYFRSSRSQARPLPLQPQPAPPGLPLPQTAAGPPPSRAEPGSGKIAEPELARPLVVPAEEAARQAAWDFAAEEDAGVPASEGERAKFGYWRSPRSGARKVGEGLGTAVEVAREEVEGVDEKPLVPPAEIAYWGSKRARSPKSCWGKTEAVVKEVEGGVAKTVDDLEDVVEDASKRVDPAKIGYWRHGRVVDPGKYAPAALVGKAAALTEAVPKAVPDITVPAIPMPQKAQQAADLGHRAASEYSPSEYSDFRSSIVSFHSSHDTLSSGQRRPQTGMRNAISSPYL